MCKCRMPDLLYSWGAVSARCTMHNRFADLATLGEDGDGEEWQIAVGKKRSPKVKALALRAVGAEETSQCLLLTSHLRAPASEHRVTRLVI